MKLNMGFLTAIDTCEEGKREAIDAQYLGMEYDAVVKNLVRRGKRDEAGWLLLFKDTEVYVKHGGEVIKMGAYQVFNPLTGQHTRYETEAKARTALLEVAQEILRHYSPTVMQEMSNENGDTTWTPTIMHESLKVSL